MDTLPRFRLPDESSAHDAITTRLRPPASEFDDLESMTTRVRERTPAPGVEEPFDAMPTKVRPALGRILVVRSRRELDLRRAKNDAPVEDVVEELRAAAAGRKPRVRELPSSDVLPDAGKRDDTEEVDVSELMFDRVVPPREVWNVRQAAPRSPMVTALIEPRSSSRFIMTAALATFLGALLALGAALLAWRMAGLSF